MNRALAAASRATEPRCARIASLRPPAARRNYDEARRVISSAPPTWKSDAFGLFLPADAEPIPPAESHDQVFCMNCREAGHAADECREPTFADLLRLMKERRLRPSE
jgi:hypothetical protein